MNQRQRQIAAALGDDAGALRDVSRIELEVLGDGVRWTAFAGSRRLVSIPAAAADVPAMLQTTETILRAMLAPQGVAHA